MDTIANKALVNKRMIYHYFGSKENLFKAVLENAYISIRKAEQTLCLEKLSATKALEKLIRFTWEYYLAHPEFIRLVNSANLHQGKHIRDSDRLKESSRNYIALIQSILDQGVAEGVFKTGIDPIQLNITIAAIGYYYLTNQYTGSILFERDYMSNKALKERLKFNIDTIMSLVRCE